MLEFKYWFESPVNYPRIQNLGFDIFVFSPNVVFNLSNNKSAMILYNNRDSELVI